MILPIATKVSQILMFEESLHYESAFEESLLAIHVGPMKNEARISVNTYLQKGWLVVGINM